MHTGGQYIPCCISKPEAISSSSGLYAGVYGRARSAGLVYETHLTFPGKHKKHMGTYARAEEAALAYDR